MTKQEAEKWEQFCSAIRRGISRDAIEALEEYFGTDNCTFVYRDKNGYPLASDYNTLVLLAATRDGQREVITTIKKILNS